MERQSDELRDVEELIRSGKPYALFLRSFDAEKAGLKHSNDELWHQWYEERLGIDLAGFPPPMQDYSDVWTLQGALVYRLGQRLPTVQLGAPPSLDRWLITGSLLNDGVTRIMTGNGTWWAAFELLARHARIIVVLVDVSTPSLVKEVDYLRSHHLRFVCVQRQETPATSSDDTIGYQDYDDVDFSVFERMLDDALKS